MEFLLPIVLGASALVFITMPFWGGASQLGAKRRAEAVLTSQNLDLDRELGKMDDDEWRELRPLVAQNEIESVGDVESLIGQFRRARRLDLSLESEILVARARKKRLN